MSIITNIFVSSMLFRYCLPFIMPLDDFKGTDCITDGMNSVYNGTINTTKSGRICQKWSLQAPHNHDKTWIGNHNYCRNPYLDPGGPWCFTTDEKVRFEYCDIPICENRPIERTIYCPAVKCYNNGTLLLETCTCSCLSTFSGLFCETEMKSTQWPDGNYALHTSMFGCPEDVNYGWMAGYVNMTLLPNSRNMFWNDLEPYTFEPHILGPYTQQAIQINFCIMNSNTTAPDNNGGNKPWPAGNYCIYKANNMCPIGFNEGSMTVRGYTYDLGGDLPYINTDNSTDLTLTYCCREDGNADEPIQLPQDFPFILFLGPTTEKCQEVDNMKGTLDGFFLANEHLNFEFDGLHPNFSNHDIYQNHVGLPLCYYEPLSRRECMFKTDYGASYKGYENTTKSGRKCSLWEDNNYDFTTSTKWIGEFEENYCRKIDMGLETPPGCYVDDEFESCDIPECEDDPEYLEIFGKGRSYNSAPSLSSSPASNAVDGLIGAGISYRNSRMYSKPWYLLNLQEYVEVHAIIIHRQQIWFPVNHRYVGTYVSKHRWDFLTYGAYRCEENRNPRKSPIFRYQCKRPIIGQYISVTNFDFTNESAKQGYYHYLEIDEIQVIGKSTMCGRQLGLISGDVYDYQLESSSRKDKDHLSNYGRLFFPETGWCSSSDDLSPWFMVDFIVPLKLQGVELQGIKDGSNVRFINSFTIMYGNDRSNLTIYEDPIGTLKLFRIDPMISSLSIHPFIFNKEIYGRYLKVVPVDYKEACLKLEVIGCPIQARRDMWCRHTKFDFGFEVLRYHTFWMAEHHDMERMEIKGIDVKQCLERCQNISCISFVSEYQSSDCTLHFGHKYTPEYHKWWIEGVKPGYVYYQRLCFKDILEFNTCGGDVFLENDNDETTILSPNFPLSYGQGLSCVWFIHSYMFIKIEIVSVSLQRKFLVNEMQKMGIYDINPGECEDSLSIIDNDGYGKTILPNEEKLNGVKLLSASNKIKIQLTTCYHFQRNNQKSFELKVSTIDLQGCGGLDSCFKTCNQPSAYIYTPGFPISYQPGEACFWKIEGVYGQFVKLTIINIDIKDDSSCEKSFISVYDIDLQGQAKHLGKFCKDNRPYETFISSWERLQIEFKAASDIPGSGGFLGKYIMETFIQESFDSSNDSCPDNWHAFRNSCYSLQKKKFGITWIEAENECKIHNGHLVSIADISEMKFIHYLITVFKDNLEGDRAYIGLKKKTNGYTMRDYIWSDGKPLTFTAWFFDKSTGFAQPDGLENEQCSIIQLFSIHNINAWHDVACAYNKISNFICETGFDSNVNDNIRNSINPMTAQPDEILYLCGSGEYILNVFICDSVIDCISGDDEHNCSFSCSHDQFTCDDGSCISISLHCDFIQHCKDGSDEAFCERRSCSSNEWQCKNMQCIPVHQRCDFEPNCYDKSDEIKCEICGADSFQCYDQTCIPFSRVCDGVIDCSGLFHEDESEDCLKKTQHTCKYWYAIGSTENGVYLIDLYLNDSASVECIFDEWENYTQITTIVHHDNEETVTANIDGFDITPVYYASDAHIEVLKEIGKCSQAIAVYCHYSENRVYRSSLYGGVIDNKTPKNDCGCPFVGNCDSGVKRCNCGNEPYDWYTADNNEIRSDIGVIYNETQLPVKHTYTNPSSTYVKLRLGPIQCIEDVQISSNIFRCRGGHTVSSDVLCILDYDEKKEILGCRDLSHLSKCEMFHCHPGYLKCQDSYCIPPKLMCNGVQDCPAGEDESYCGKPECDGLFRCHQSDICLNLDKRCNGFAECPLFDDELLCEKNCTSNCKCHGLSSKCVLENRSIIEFPSETRKIDLSMSNLSVSDMMLENNFLLAELNLSSTRLRDLERIHFGKFHYNLYLLDVSLNQITIIPRHTFEGMVHLKILLFAGNSLLEIFYPQSFTGLLSVSTMSLVESNIWLLRSNNFMGVENLKALNLSHNKIEKVEDRTFEGLNQLKSLDIRGNRMAEFQKDIFEGLESLEKLYSDAYVFCCLKPNSVKEEDCLPARDEFSSCSDMMRNDILRICLWVIGLCALIGNLIVLVYRVIYDRGSLSKSYGIFITSLGASDFLMGVYMLTIASADVMFRGNYVWNDLSWRYGVPCKIAGIISTVSSECSVCFLFLITIDRFVAIKYPFGEIRFGKRSAGCISCSVFIICFIIAVVPVALPSSYFDGNFYSRSAVCLALPLTREKPNGWEYSFGIFIVFNFILFLIIAGMQLIIYREVTNTMNNVRSTKKNQDLTIARNLFIVVFSDFLCWFPVGVMGLMALHGHSIPAEVYAWTAVFILPINSALNPFLYTFSAVFRTRRVQRRASSHICLTKQISIVSQDNTNDKIKDLFGNIASTEGLVEKIVNIVEHSLQDSTLDEDDIETIISKLNNVKETPTKT